MARRGGAERGVALQGMAGVVRHGMARRSEARQGIAGRYGEARQNDNGDRPVAAWKDGLHLNNAERHEMESEE